MNPNDIRQIACAPAGDSETGSSADESAGTLTQAKQAIASTARDTAARIKSAASDTADRAKTEAQRLASETKDNTAKRLGGYGSAMHESAKSFEDQDPNIAWATHKMADRIQGMADYVRNSDFNDLRADAENFARRHPLAFFGGLFIGGLVIGNLLKAGQSTSSAANETEPDWDTGNASGSEDISESTATGGI
jgi:hypothetical protein